MTMKKNNIKFSDGVFFLTHFKMAIKDAGLKNLFMKKIAPEEYKNNYQHMFDKFDNYAWFKISDAELEKVANTPLLLGIPRALDKVMAGKLQNEISSLWGAAVSLQENETLSQMTRDRLADLLIDFHETAHNINVKPPSVLNTVKCIFTRNYDSCNATLGYKASLFNNEWESWKRMNMVLDIKK